MKISRFSIAHKDRGFVELVSKTSPKTLAVWGMDFAVRVLSYFEENL